MSYYNKLSIWPRATSTSARQRKDVELDTFQKLAGQFRKPRPYKVKTDQPLLTRCWQDNRGKNSEDVPPYLITLDYDSVDESPLDVHERLKEFNISHFIFTTWSHKTLSTPQKNNNGKNCFKVIPEVTADNKEELLNLTRSLAAKTGKEGITRPDDLSAAIFLQGVHPDFEEEFEFYYFKSKSKPASEIKSYLISTIPEEELAVKADPLDDFEHWDKTKGQKYTVERIKQALKTIQYELIGGMTLMQVWYTIGYALKSTEDNGLFDLWDNWCLEKCSEHNVYDREENENFWDKSTPKDKENICTLSSLWYLEKLFKARESSAKIRSGEWTCYGAMAKEEPEEVKYLIKDLIVDKSIGFITGSGGVGKSGLCSTLAKHISSGTDLYGDDRFPCTKGSVALINKEDSENKVHNHVHREIELDIRNAMKSPSDDFGEVKVELSPDEKDEFVSRWDNVYRPQWAQNNTRLTNDKGEDLEAIGAVLGSLKNLQKHLAEENKPPLTLVIFDPLNMWHGGDQNAQKDMSYIFSAMQQVQQQLQVTVIIVHHMNKLKGFSGSHVLRDSGRFMWYLRPKMIGKIESNLIELYVEKNNDAKANYTAMHFIMTDTGVLDRVDPKMIELDKENEK